MMKKNISIEVNSPKFGAVKSGKKGSSRVKVYENRDNYIGSSISHQPEQSGHYFQTQIGTEKKFQEDIYNIKEQQSANRSTWESKLSLIMSTASIPTSPKVEFSPQRIFNLENRITQQILQLRQQKITLMQDLSKALDAKNLFEHYLLKNERGKAEKDTVNDSAKKDSINLDKSPKSYKSSMAVALAASRAKESYVPLNVSAPILKKNEQLHLKLKELQVNEQIFGQSLRGGLDEQKSKVLLEQIIKVRGMNSNLKNEIAERLKNEPLENANRNSRFVTFLPQDRQKHFAAKNSSTEYQELQDKYNKLVSLNKQPYFRMTLEESEYLQNLRRQNRRLIEQVDAMLKTKKNGSPARLADLRRQVEDNERDKQAFFCELQAFKQTMKKVKEQNEQLRSLLGR